MRLVRRAKKAVLRALPRGPKDAVLQLGLFVVADLLYEAIRGISDGSAQLAFSNGRAIAGLEQKLSLFFEPSLQHLVLKQQWLVEAANWAYMNTHFVVTTAFLIWLYFARNDNFYFVRNMFMVAMGLALVGYLAIPTAPPRMLASLGFTDTIVQFSHISSDSTTMRTLINPYAAVPSMHMAFAIMISVPAYALVKSHFFKAGWALYPLLVLFVIMVTANHFWFDALVGALVAAVAAVAAERVLSRLKPYQWGWQPAVTEQPL